MLVAGFAPRTVRLRNCTVRCIAMTRTVSGQVRGQADHTQAAAAPLNPDGPPLDFNDARLAFAHKSSFEICRAWMLLKLCSMPLVVNNARSVRTVKLGC